MKVELRGAVARYGQREVLRGVDLSLAPGRMNVVVGPNGSGKSTLIKVVAGLVGFEGQLLFDGSERRPSAIGHMPQDISSHAALTVLEAVLLGRWGQLGWRVGEADLQAVQQMLDRLGLEALAGRLLGELSGGQRQMVFLAQALIGSPQVLLLDEPISALDIGHQLEVLDTVRALTRERQLSTLMVLHDLNAASRWGDDVLLLHDGRVLASGSADAVLTPAHLGQAFRVEVERIERPGQPGWLLPVRALDSGAGGAIS